MERLSISLNEKSVAIIKKYQQKYDTSQAEFVRKALHYLDAMDEVTEKHRWRLSWHILIF